MDEDDFKSILDMLASEDSESHVLAVKILLNNVNEQPYYYHSNITSQSKRLLGLSTDINYILAHAVAKITIDELQS